jgi:L-threonylcarbamoyladenylate synthase
MRRVFVDPGAPQRDAIDEAAMWIRRGGIVAYPTDTLYGLGADPFSGAAVARVFEVKGRPSDRALPLIAADAAQVEARLGRLSATAARLAAKFWPGPLTIVMPAPRALARDVAANGTVGVRVPAHDIARRIAAIADTPITATSANITGRPATADPDDVERALGGTIDLLIDAGPTRGGAPSTIVDVTGREARLVRAGAVPWEEVQACLLG